MKKFNFKKICITVLSFVLVTTVFISCFAFSASAVEFVPQYYADLKDFDYGFYCVGVDGNKNVFYNGPYLTEGYGEPLPYYQAPNPAPTQSFKSQFAWNGRQNYFYLPATNTLTSGKYTWSGRCWFAKTDNNDYHRNDWSGKNLSYWQKEFITVPAGYSLHCRLFFGLPQLNYDDYGVSFIGDNINISFYTTDYSATFVSSVRLFATASYNPGWDLPFTGSSSNAIQCAMDVVLAVDKTVNLTSVRISITGISADYGGLLVDNCFMFCKVTSDNEWGNNEIKRNEFQQWFLDLGETISNGFNNVINKIETVVGGVINSILSGEVLSIIEGAISSLGDIISSLFNVANTQGGPIPVG